MPIPQFTLAAQVGRVPSMRVPLDQPQELRFQRLLEDLHKNQQVAKITRALDILAAHQAGQIGFLPTLEQLRSAASCTA